MIRELFLSALFVALTAMPAAAQYVPYPGNPYPGNRPQLTQPTPVQTGYWVQFRQTYWRQQTFYTEFEMANFINSQRALGWEVQVVPSPLGIFSVRYRLMQWGGSRTVSTMAEAQQWAAYLEDLGYEPRIVPLSQ